MFLKNTVKKLFSSKKQTTRKPKHIRNSRKSHKHHKKTKQNSRYKQSGFKNLS